MRMTSRNKISLFATRDNYRHTKAEEDTAKNHKPKYGPKNIQAQM